MWGWSIVLVRSVAVKWHGCINYGVYLCEVRCVHCAKITIQVSRLHVLTNTITIERYMCSVAYLSFGPGSYCCSLYTGFTVCFSSNFLAINTFNNQSIVFLFTHKKPLTKAQKLYQKYVPNESTEDSQLHCVADFILVHRIAGPALLAHLLCILFMDVLV